VWIFDGKRFELVARTTERGEVETLSEVPAPFQSACQQIQQSVHPASLRAVLFPILPATAGKE
jgi:hypothetical protein